MATGSPPAWATAWGEDRYGVFCEFSLPAPARVPTQPAVTQRLRWIPPGTFRMGSPLNEEGRFVNERAHEVQLTEGFWLFDTPCTQALWDAVMDANPSRVRGDRLPVTDVSWEHAQQFFSQLWDRYSLDFTLPTEAQWEYACRAGGPAQTQLAEYAWYGENSGGKLQPVGQLQANRWGLYDMLGNVYEWCGDWFGDYAEGEPQTDPTGPYGGSDRVMRGGAWHSPARFFVRAALRRGSPPDYRRGFVGFRPARVQSL